MRSDKTAGSKNPHYGKTCRMGYMYAKIHANGDAFRCCIIEDKGRLGNLIDGTFAFHDAPAVCELDSCDCWVAMVENEEANWSFHWTVPTILYEFVALPEEIKQKISDAKNLLQQGKVKRSVSLLNEIDRAYPKNPEVLRLLEESRSIVELSEEAKERIAEVRRMREIGQTASAIAILESVDREYPGHADIIITLAECYTLQAEFDKAFDRLGALLRRQKENSWAIRAMGSVFQHKGEYQPAREYYLKAVNAADKVDAGLAYLGLAQIDVIQGDQATAEQNFRKAIELCPGNQYILDEYKKIAHRPQR